MRDRAVSETLQFIAFNRGILSFLSSTLHATWLNRLNSLVELLVRAKHLFNCYPLDITTSGYRSTNLD
jgi:hypothetical protein